MIIIRPDLTFPPQSTLPWHGLIKCRVLAPQDLKYPVLGIKLDDALLFQLCYSCARAQENGICTHKDPKYREFIGTWYVCVLQMKFFLQVFKRTAKSPRQKLRSSRGVRSLALGTVEPDSLLRLHQEDANPQSVS